MSAVGTFIVSLLVALLCIPFARYQGRKTADAIQEHSPANNGRQKTVESVPRINEILVEQALDTAYAFPALVLTAVAYAQLITLSPLSVAILLVMSIVTTLGLAWLMSPSRAPRFERWKLWRLSLATWLLLVANIVGLIWSVFDETIL